MSIRRWEESRIGAQKRLQYTTSGNGEILDINVVNNAYGKNRGFENFMKSSTFLYIDPNKKRTDTWCQRLGLQLPSGNTMYGSIGRISYADGDVNIQGVSGEEIFGKVKTADKKPTINRETIPSRAQAYLRGTEKKMLNRLGGASGQQYSISEEEELDMEERKEYNKEKRSKAERRPSANPVWAIESGYINRQDQGAFQNAVKRHSEEEY